MSMIGGFLFGALRGTLYTVVSATLGAIVSFLFLRSVLRNTIANKYQKQLQKFKKGIDEYGVFYLLILHFLFVFPFFVINSLAALANISVLRFTWTTAIGIIPAAFVYAFAGKQIMSIQSGSDVLSARVIIALALLVISIVLAMLFKRFQSRR